MNDNVIEYFELDEQRNNLRMQIVALADGLTSFIGCGVLQIKEIEPTLIKIKALHDELDQLEQRITKSLDESSKKIANDFHSMIDNYHIMDLSILKG